MEPLMQLANIAIANEAYSHEEDNETVWKPGSSSLGGGPTFIDFMVRMCGKNERER